MGEAEFVGALVHPVGEGLLAAGHSLGEDDRGVVAGLDDEAAQQVLDPHVGVHVEKSGGCVGVGAAGSPSVL